MTKKRAMTAMSLAAAIALTFTACGGDDKAEETTTTAAATETTAAATETTAAATETTAAGTETTAAAAPVAADPSLEPVVIGMHNLEGGAISLPQIRQGFEKAIEYANAELGGINGHPIKVEACPVDLTPESAVNCANKFVEQKVAVAAQGVDVLADAGLPIYQAAGIADTGFFAFSPGINAAPDDAFFTLFSNEEGYFAAVFSEIALGHKNIAWLLSDLPTSHAVFDDLVTPLLAKLPDIKITPFYYPQTQTDWTSFAATVLAINPDGVTLPAPQEAECLGALPAFRAAGYTGDFHAGSCVEVRNPANNLSDEIMANVFSHSEYEVEEMTSVTPEAAADFVVYHKYMDSLTDVVNTTYGKLGFAFGVDLVRMMQANTSEDLSAAGFKTAMKTAKGRKFFTNLPFDCANRLFMKASACGVGINYSKNLPGGKLEKYPWSPIDVRAELEKIGFTA